MGMGAPNQQGSQVYYDPDMGQYYTETTPRGNLGSLFMGNLSPLNNPLTLQNMIYGKNTRNYLNNFNQRQQVEQSPYQYANTSLESLFPSSQGGGNSALASLLGSSTPSATGSASSGAGRFM